MTDQACGIDGGDLLQLGFKLGNPNDPRNLYDLVIPLKQGKELRLVADFTAGKREVQAYVMRCGVAVPAGEPLQPNSPDQMVRAIALLAHGAGKLDAGAEITELLLRHGVG